MVQVRPETHTDGSVSIWFTPSPVPVSVSATHVPWSRRLQGKIWLDFSQSHRLVRVRLRSAKELVCRPDVLEWDIDLVEESDHLYIALSRAGEQSPSSGTTTYEALDDEHKFMDGMIRLDFNKRRQLTGIEVEEASRLMP